MNALLRARLLRKPAIPHGYLTRRDVTVRSWLKRLVITAHCNGWLPAKAAAWIFRHINLRSA